MASSQFHLSAGRRLTKPAVLLFAVAFVNGKCAASPHTAALVMPLCQLNSKKFLLGQSGKTAAQNAPELVSPCDKNKNRHDIFTRSHDGRRWLCRTDIPLNAARSPAWHGSRRPVAQDPPPHDPIKISCLLKHANCVLSQLPDYYNINLFQNQVLWWR